VDRQVAKQRTARYERDGSDCRAYGSVSIGDGAWWSAELVVSMTREQSALLTIERQGPLPEGIPVGGRASLVVCPGEADAIVCLLNGIVAQAHCDGILRDATRS
jgi:hypothetical protein